MKEIKNNRWTDKDTPSQAGKTAIITGTGGIGYETALVLARAGSKVILAGRNESKGKASINKIMEKVADADIVFELLDLADLASIRSFGERMISEYTVIDTLINNAGVMSPPQRRLTNDGFELQFGTNYLSHFALTSLMLPLLKKAKDPRVITLGSIAHRNGSIDFDNLQSEHKYEPSVAYAQSKLACIMFAFELQRKSDAKGWGITSMSAHPGVSRTDLIPNGFGPNSRAGWMRRILGPITFQPASHGAWPSLYAATEGDVSGGTYYGPSKMNELRGYPRIAQQSPQANDAMVAARLWEVSEELTHCRFE